jgi:predicted GIY-YIG superfamily endonuclease
MTPRSHALYRFFSGDDELLYIGISLEPAARWGQHRADKPWWSEVATVTVETVADRELALAAEREAIIAEQPRYNVVHNRGATVKSPAKEQIIVEPTRLAPIQVGDWVALGLVAGDCPVGQVMALDERFVSVRLVSFVHGYLMDRTTVVRWSDVVRAEVQYPEFAEGGDDGQVVMNLDPLAEFQTAWSSKSKN